MHALGDDYEALINQYVSPERPTTPFYSSVKGKPLVDSGALNASYWRENLESPVLFYTAIKAILDGRKLKSKIFLEVGPHSALAGPLRQIFKSSLSEDLTYVPTLTRGKDCTRSLLTTAGQLFSLGASVDYSAIVPYGDVLTDLPVYPWHHDTEYWSESRLSREWRLRRYPHHDILGSRIAEGSDLEPTWRNTLNLDAVPWVRDHKLHSDMVFPFAGYIAMAGEAVRQLSAEDEDFSLRRVVVKNALVLQESARMEMMTNLRPMRLTDSLNSTWYEFSIASLSNGVWTNHCTGEVRSGSDNAQRSTLPHENLLPRIVSSTRWYKTMRSVGLAYGPAFQGLRDISAHTSDGSAAATVRNESMRHESFYYLHPTAIDVCLQLFSVAGSKGVPRMLHQLSVPVFAEEIYIRSYSNELRLHVKAGSSVKGITVGDALATSAGRITMTMKGLKMSAIEDTDNFRVPDPLAGARFHWKPDIDFLDCKDLIWPSASKVDLALVLERFTVLCMIENSLQLRDLESSIGYFLKYRRWMTGQAKLAEQGKYPLIPDAQRFAALDSLGRISLIMSIAETVKETEAAPLVSALLNVFESLPAMFVGDKDPLAMFFQDDSFSDLYTIFSSLWDHSHFFDHLTHQRPNMRILEIGAGTGGTTALLMKYLKSQYQERMYSNYTFTDISSGFLIKAKERFSFAESMEFSILDISKDPLEQGFQVESYDLIIASNVFSACLFVSTEAELRTIGPSCYAKSQAITTER